MRHGGENWLMGKNTVKDYIITALWVLLKQKPYREVTVKDIVEKAGVCRASFYRNFFSMDEVLNEMVEGLFFDIYHESPMTADNISQCVEQVFHGALLHKDKLKLLFARGLFDKVTAKLYEKTLSQIKELDVFNNCYQPYFFSGASASLIYAWVKNDFKESAQEMSAIFMQCLHGYMET